MSEMHTLFTERRCTVFLFQDDDFPVETAGNNIWVETFCSELERTGLSGKVIWKINCRPDEVNQSTFLLMKRHGLFLVYIGLEEGTDEGLAWLNKRMTAATGLHSVEILKDLGIGFDYGMMLFQPESSFESLRENLKFLKLTCSNGYSPMAFSKLLPYFDTKVEKDLREHGRLRGEPGNLNYDFNCESLDACWSAVSECFAEWLWGRGRRREPR